MSLGAHTAKCRLPVFHCLKSLRVPMQGSPTRKSSSSTLSLGQRPMHLTPSFPEHKSSGPPKIPIEWTQRRLSSRAVGQSSPCGFQQPHLLPYTRSFFPVTSEMAPDVARPQARRPRDNRAEQSQRRPGVWRAFRATAPSKQVLRACGREGDPGRGRAGGESTRKRGGKVAMAAQVTVPTVAAGSPRRRASSARVEGSFGETESKSPGGGGGAGGPGGAVRTARESWGRAGTRSTERAPGEARTGSSRGKRSPPTCCVPPSARFGRPLRQQELGG